MSERTPDPGPGSPDPAEPVTGEAVAPDPETHDVRDHGPDGHAPIEGEPAGRGGKDPLRRSRTSGAWTGVITAAILLVLLIVFIAQNTQDVHISFLAWDGSAPLSVALLIATVTGIAITAVVGTLRIWQLRRRVRRERHRDRH